MKITPRFVRDRTSASRRVSSSCLARIHHPGNRLSFLDNDMRACVREGENAAPNGIIPRDRSLYPARSDTSRVVRTLELL